MMGVKKILLTNAAGGVNPSFKPGDFMLITDHITTAVPSPLIGPNIEELGTRFPDMSEVYSKKLQEIIRKSAKDCGIALREGVYVQLTGPNYETPAEIRMVRSWGADAVGMSTACEPWQPDIWEWKCAESPALRIWQQASVMQSLTTPKFRRRRTGWQKILKNL